VVSISSYVHNSLPSNLIRVSTECVKNPFDTETIYSKKISREAINTEYPFLKDVFLLGYVGRIVPWKRIENILYALQKVVFHTNDTYKVYLIITGEGDTNYVNQIANLIQFLGLNDCVIMTGFVSNPSVTLAALDLLIASSYNEPFGRVVVEAMIQKTPVLASKSGGHIETVVHNKTGLLYEKSSSNLLAEYICRVMSKNIDINPIVDVAYKEVVLEYSASKHSDKMISIYMKLVHG